MAMIFVCGMIYEDGKSPVPVVYDEVYKICLASDSHVITKLSHDACPLKLSAPVLDDGIVICCKDGVYTCIDDVWYFDDAPVTWCPEVNYIGHLMSKLFKSSGQFFQCGFVKFGKHRYEILSSTCTYDYYFLTPELNCITLDKSSSGVRIPMNLKVAEQLLDHHEAEAIIWTTSGIHILKGDCKGVSYNPDTEYFTYKILTDLNYMSLAYTDFNALFHCIYKEMI